MKKALIVGINDYPTDPLRFCENDASSISTLLETHGDGAPNFDVNLILNVKTKSEFKSAVVDLFSGKCDTALLYFSGHGFINEIGGYLVTPDHRRYDEGISMDEILSLANKSQSTDKIIVLDCCHSGTMGSPEIVGSSAQLNDGITILTASKADEAAIEINGHGLFTNLLIDALQGGAADLRGHISPGSVYSYIDQALGAWDQRPVFKTNVTKFTSLRTVSPQVSIEVIRKIIELFPNPQDHFELDPSYEDTNSKSIEHTVIEPHADPNNVYKFKQLQKLQSVGLVVPVDAEHMYFAAMESKSCRLTSLGYHYWRLVKEKRI